MSTVTDLFADIDRMDANAFASHLSEDCTLRFGNAPEVQGRQAIEDSIAQFFGLIEGLQRRIVEQWESGDATILQLEVTYTRLDGHQATIPVCTLYRRGERFIDDYRVFIDLAPVLG